MNRVDDVVELMVLVDVGGHHRADGDDPQPGVAGRLQRFGDENRCQAAAFEVVVDLGVGEDSLIVAVV